MTPFGELVRKVAGAKTLILAGVLPGAVVCGLVAGALAMPSPPASGPVVVRSDATALQHYKQGALAMATADLSRMTPDQAMDLLSRMARKTLQTSPESGSTIRHEGMETAVAFFAGVDLDARVDEIQEKAAELARSTGADFGSARFDGVLTELAKANERKSAILTEIADALFDNKEPLDAIIRKAKGGLLERHAADNVLLEVLAWQELFKAELGDEHRDAVTRESNAKAVMDGAFSALIAQYETRTMFTSREAFAKIVRAALPAVDADATHQPSRP